MSGERPVAAERCRCAGRRPLRASWVSDSVCFLDPACGDPRLVVRASEVVPRPLATGIMSAVSSPRSLAYDEPDVLTAIAPELVGSVARLPAADAVDLCRAAQGLVIPPDLASALGVPEERLTEKSIRSVTDLLQVILSLSPVPLRDRVAQGSSRRHVSTLQRVAGCRVPSLPWYRRSRSVWLRHLLRSGQVRRPLDHRVLAHRCGTLDPRRLGGSWDLIRVSRPDDLSGDEFLTGGEAWKLCRLRTRRPFAVRCRRCTAHVEIGEVRGNTIRDLAALNKVEMLPWDEWGRMQASYKGETGADFDELMDAVATVCESNDLVAIGELYANEDLAGPGQLIV